MKQVEILKKLCCNTQTCRVLLKILNVLKDKPHTLRSIAKELNYSPKNIKKYLDLLKQLGFVHEYRVGNGNIIVYTINSEIEKELPIICRE